MDIRGIQYFISLAENLNFTKAAKECFITQTAMSQHIANMEKELGFTLFNRTNRNVQLTVAGREFYEQMKMLMHNYNTAVRHSQNMAHGSEGSIVIAMPSCFESLVFRSRLRNFIQQNPTINVTVNIMAPREMNEAIKRREVDIAISWPHEMIDDDSITVQQLAEFKSQVVVSNSHPLAGQKSVAPERLQRENVIMLDLSGMHATQRAMHSDWKSLGLKPPTGPTFKRLNSLEEMLLAVAIHDVVGLVPEFVTGNGIGGDLTILDLDMPNPPMFQMGIGYLKGNPNPALPAVLSTLRDSRIPLNY